MRSLTLAVVQFSPRFGRKAENLRRMEALVSGTRADIMIFPELCTTGYFFTTRDEVAAVAETPSGGSVEFFRALAKRHNTVVVAGWAETDQGRLFNSCLIVLPEQEEPFIYRKTHLFYKETQCFDAGDTGFFVVHDAVRDVRIGPMVCYDWRFPEAARVLTLLGADLIACPANLVTEAWHLVMPARAIENKVYVAVANRAGTEARAGEELVFKGSSAIYDWSGRSLRQAGPHGDTVLLAEIRPAQTRDKSFNPLNDVLRDRRPEFYAALTADRKP
jgi:predicted amidohydrolase